MFVISLREMGCFSRSSFQGSLKWLGRLPRRTVKSETSVPPFIMISAVGWWNATGDRGGRLEHQKDFRAEYWPARSTTPDGTLSLPNSGTRLQAPGESW